jgi:hypothetical protein
VLDPYSSRKEAFWLHIPKQSTNRPPNQPPTLTDQQRLTDRGNSLHPAQANNIILLLEANRKLPPDTDFVAWWAATAASRPRSANKQRLDPYPVSPQSETPRQATLNPHFTLIAAGCRRGSGLKSRKILEKQQIHSCEMQFTRRKPTSKLIPEGFCKPGTSTSPQMQSEPGPLGHVHDG